MAIQVIYVIDQINVTKICGSQPSTWTSLRAHAVRLKV